jgi:hypothetical protein
MDSREFLNLQEALIWVFWPVVQLLLGVMLGMSILTALYQMFARLARWLTRSD